MHIINYKRVRPLKEGPAKEGPVLYWMNRDQRVRDNWALLYAQKIAIERKVPLVVLFCFFNYYPRRSNRHFIFMLRGLQEVEQDLHEHNIPFFLIQGNPEFTIPSFIKEHDIGIVITDFDPLKDARRLRESVAQKINIPLYEVDAHNIIPPWIVSPKQEYAAYTIRPKIKRLLPEFLSDIPSLVRHPFTLRGSIQSIDWEGLLKKFEQGNELTIISWLKPGSNSGMEKLKDFLESKLKRYAEMRNNPVYNFQSNLSPYLHFGQISAQRVALEVIKIDSDKKSKEAFLEELIIRRELAENFCFYNKEYDNFNGFPEWAKQTLNKHRNDKRLYLYDLNDFERAATHDPLWNAAQLQMIKTGKMHGYMRMYWAKKILEWTESPEQALEFAIYLNDKYEIDGYDPNGFTAIAWSIGGVHDRPWPERKIFGKIRYMSYNGCRNKFDVDEYIKRWLEG
ncbi:MAG: deoxyribodipyrimidine photo-lyase [Thermodesulfovibrionales bacterium]|nr:deoxyribodipyrimidine photo-lyase [Thermodesulfovibrionales bacterium]